jgi:hypothetical protein
MAEQLDMSHTYRSEAERKAKGVQRKGPVLDGLAYECGDCGRRFAGWTQWYRHLDMTGTCPDATSTDWIFGRACLSTRAARMVQPCSM